MSNCPLLLSFFLLIVSCGKAKDTRIEDETVIISQEPDSPASFTSTTLKERYLNIEDSIAFYVARLKNIENRFYTGDFNNEELMPLSLEGLELQEKLTRFLRCSIVENIENLLGIYMLAVYGELFTAYELHSLIKRIPPNPVYTSNNPFYEMIMQTLQERIKNNTGARKRTCII